MTGAAGAHDGSSQGPLTGVRVLELGHVMAGPVCGRMLADLGADVVKVEPPSGDPARTFSPGDTASDAAFAMLNRGKRGIVLDLKRPEGGDALRRMALQADVLIENYRPGVLDGLGLGYDRLAEANPRLVYASISGFGPAGPWAERGGFDLIAQAASGIVSVTGEPDGQAPTKCGPPVTDILAGVLGTLGVVSALHARAASGRGDRVHTSLYQAGTFLTLWHAAAALDTGSTPGPLGSAHPLAAPYELFPTADGWVAVGGSSQRAWERLTKVLEAPELARDERFRTNPGRMAHLEELRGLLRARFASEGTATWLGRLTRAGVPVAPVHTVPEMLDHPQTAAVGMVATDARGNLTLGLPLLFSAGAQQNAGAVPDLGADTRTVLREYGLAEPEIDAVIHG